MYLSKINEHERDKNIHFYEPTHTYTIKGMTDFTSTTTFVHEHFRTFDANKIVDGIIKKDKWRTDPTYKYYQKPKEEILKEWNDNGKKQSGLGTQLHLNIEIFMNQELVDEDNNSLITTHDILYQVYENECHEGIKQPDDSKEWGYFIRYIKDHPTFQPYRTEWFVYDEELKLAGSIDMVYLNPDGTLNIYDWKRSKSIEYDNSYNNAMAITECISTIPDSNFWHYSLQLNTYKAMIEKNYGKKVKELFLVILHPNNDNYVLIECADLQEEVAKLFEHRKKQLSKSN
jgi:ATP-dependent exoDNAse (exonuclease V) beta subunit